mmetsp:Transcript_27621/g.38954  ORF Transcript_27621/g.38954 Transcript_27621/m.38954 type:complete len:137 (+) Transcript_27621:108-518(+)
MPTNNNTTNNNQPVSSKQFVRIRVPKIYSAPRNVALIHDLAYLTGLKQLIFRVSYNILPQLKNGNKTGPKFVNNTKFMLLSSSSDSFVEEQPAVAVSATSNGNPGVVPSPLMPRFMENLISVGKSFYARAFAGFAS